MITKKKDKKFEDIFNKRNNIKFLRKSIGNIHVVHMFEIKDLSMNIDIMDRSAIQITENGIRHLYKNKHIHKYKHAEKLFNYLTDNLTKWNL